MTHFEPIRAALQYIDGHLAEPITLAELAQMSHFSPYYFHRLFTAVVGKPLAAYIRDRRIYAACRQLAETKKSIQEIALDCGFQSAQSFARAFRRLIGMPPRAYRSRGLIPYPPTAQELIIQFTNRLRGGLLIDPTLMKKGPLRIAGVSGDGSRTGEIWQRFARLSDEMPLTNALSGSGYEVRIDEGDRCTVHVGQCVSGAVDPAYEVLKLPASMYASFEVYVARGYESENGAMDEWLATNGEGYAQRPLKGGKHYCVEYYDERFQEGDANSIVEIWVPVEKDYR